MTIANKLIAQIKAHRGILLVPVHNANWTMHVAVVKSDLIEQLRPVGDKESGFCMLKMDDGDWTIDSDDNVNNED